MRVSTGEADTLTAFAQLNTTFHMLHVDAIAQQVNQKLTISTLGADPLLTHRRPSVGIVLMLVTSKPKRCMRLDLSNDCGLLSFRL